MKMRGKRQGEGIRAGEERQGTTMTLVVIPRSTFTWGRMEGRGTTTGASLSPRVYDGDGGGWRMRMRASSFLPLSFPRYRRRGAGCVTHTPPHSHSFTLPIVGRDC